VAKDLGVPGNSMAESAAFAELQANYGMGLTRFEHICSRHWRGEVEVLGFSVRPPKENSAERLVIVRGVEGQGTPVVAFHSAIGLGEAVAGASGRIANGHIEWKLDSYRAGNARS